MVGGIFMPSRGRGGGSGALVDNRTFKLVLLDIEVRNEYFEGQGKVIRGLLITTYIICICKN